MPKSELLQLLFAPLLFFIELRELFDLVVLYKRATVSESLPTLFTKEQPWAIMYLQLLLTEEGRDRFAIFQEQITLLLSKNKQFAPKTKEQIPNPDNTTNLSGL